MTHRLIVLQPDWDQIPPTAYAEAAKLGVGTDYSDGPLLECGDRPVHEYTDDRKQHRPAPWIVVREGECYVAQTSAQAFEKIWIFKCGWQPLPEAENPWHTVHRIDPATYPDELLDMMNLTQEQVAEKPTSAPSDQSS